MVTHKGKVNQSMLMISGRSLWACSDNVVMCSLNHTDIRSDEHLSHWILVATVLNFSPPTFVSPARRLGGMRYNDNDMPRKPVFEITLHSCSLLVLVIKWKQR